MKLKKLWREVLINTRLYCITDGNKDYAEFKQTVHNGKDVTALMVDECEESSVILLSDEQLINLRDTLLDAFPLERYPYD